MTTFSNNISEIKVGSKLLGQFPVEVITWNGKTATVRALYKTSIMKTYKLTSKCIAREIDKGYMGISNN